LCSTLVEVALLRMTKQLALQEYIKPDTASPTATAHHRL
jgi:hypothetical protein